ncbi:phthiocerol/phenolphthiocerol synthesis type-I polyketide synthase C [Undibacterium sp. GrIS 1.8]|uniref:type I polyketide synthase n=1 Tax=Undibacterium sp. GrIS 1.8 TaxID=3143934 RepID=UPI003395AD27
MTKKIAVIGHAFRFPSTTTSQYWSDLLAGRDLVTEVEPERWAMDTFRHPGKNNPGTSYTFAAGSVGDISKFDASFFGISPREAALMDPQQRLLLEMSWETLENAGIKPSSIRGSHCGVYIGIASNDYSIRLADDLSTVDSSTATGNTSSIAANRLSYVLDLRGPSMAIDTACSSSLVAFHQACQAIRSGECTHALAGGVSLHLHPYGFITFSKASMLSRVGRCQVFDAAGDGYVRSEGGGIFLLKDYNQALADGDHILAVVAGSGVNTDGKKSGLTVPSAQAQADLLVSTYARAGIDPSAIDYLEAHGTGTVVGDPIETRAIGLALGQQRATPLPIGSVKSNLGHMEAASGVAGLVKALHTIMHRVVPATIGIKTLNPNIDFADLNVAVVTENLELKKTGKLVVGINSFGFGGANAHVILESALPNPVNPVVALKNTEFPVMLSAKNAAALKQAAKEFVGFMQDQPDSALFDVSYNTIFNREAHAHRLVASGTSTAAIASALAAFADGGSTQVSSGVALAKPSGPVFIYSGNGSQWFSMGARLLQESTVFVTAVREIDSIFRKYGDFSLEEELAGKNGDRYDLTEIAQPTLFALQVGVTNMLAQNGIMPVAAAGHSVGEVAAAWASGSLTLEDAVKVIYFRSAAQGTTKGRGQMTAVGCSLAAAQTLMEPDSLTVAGVNSSRGITVAGAPDHLSKLERALREGSIPFKRLPLDYAFHSPEMDSIEQSIRKTLADIRPVSGSIPFYSTVTGALLDGKELHTDYWWRNIRNPVLFEQACKQILAAGQTVFIEVGPHAVLRSYLNDCLKDTGQEGRVITTLAKNDDAPERIRAAVHLTLIAGANVEWNKLFVVPGKFMTLPTYPWQRERHWYTNSPASIGLLSRFKVHPLLGYPLQQQELCWENQIDTQLLPGLADHVVGEHVVFPGTGFVELVLAAALAWKPGKLVTVEELEIRAPLILSDKQAKLIRVHIAPADGSISISGRDVAGTEPWVVHATARILTEPGTLQAPSLELPLHTPDFTQSSHDVLTRAAGLHYGEEFQRIDHGWVDGASALMLLAERPSSSDLGNTHLHPGILDCTFQLIIQLLKEDALLHDGMAYIPVRMGRIVFLKSDTLPYSAHATLLKRSPHSLTAEFTVYDSEGAALAVITDARFKSVRLHKAAIDQLRFLDFHATPAPHPLATVFPSVTFAQMQAALSFVVQQCQDAQLFNRYSEEVEPLLDTLCSQFTLQALSALASDSGLLTDSAVNHVQKCAPQVAGFFNQLLALAEHDQLIAHREDGWQILPGEMVLANDLWNLLIADYPEYFQIIQAVGRIGMKLPELLTGAVNPAHLVSESSTHSALIRLALGDAGKQSLTSTVRDWIDFSLNHLPSGQRLGVLEISTGLPIFAADICARLDFNCSDFTFASISDSALQEAVILKEHFPHFNTSKVGAPAEAFCNLVIVQLDFASLDEAFMVLNYARSQLVDGGNLLLLGQHPSRWMDFVFGCQTNEQGAVWHSAQPEFWKGQLQLLGFTDTYSQDLVADVRSGPYVLVAKAGTSQSVRSIPAKSWLLLADEVGYSSKLADLLSENLVARGDQVRIETAGDTAHMKALLLGMPEKLDGIVYLTGLNVPVESAQAILDLQVDRCADSAALIQACESAEIDTTVSLVTANVCLDLLGDSGDLTSVADAALWGFGRTLMNEASNYAVRMVDLVAPNELEVIAASLALELVYADKETEVMLGAGGARYATRLRLEPRPTGVVAPQIEEPTLRLAFQTAGQLRNLHWETRERIMPGEHQIEVEVRATGLNFRDVMYALGLLSDEAIENGFAGPTLGLEFSGVVIQAGSKTSGFKAGDRVVGFGPASFSNRVITQDSAISLIPGHITFAAAATIPSTFLTVYYALNSLAQLQPGEKVLIHGAAGGVGIAAIQYAKWIGAEIHATAGSDEKRDFLRLFGVEHIYDSRSLAYADEILAKTSGAGIDVVLNSLAGEAINSNFRVLKPFGRFIELGKRDFYENTKIGLRPFRNNISYFGVDADQLMQVRPDLTRRLFAAVMKLFGEGVFHPLPYTVFEANDIIASFRYMQQARQIGKIVITYHQPVYRRRSAVQLEQQQLSLNPDATYLITGGLSGFGLKAAEWLVSKGARHLVLISRSGPKSEEAKTAIAAMQAKRVSVRAVACDVTDVVALSSLFKQIDESRHPIKGLIHAAMVIDDGLIRNMNPEQIRRVLAPKVVGAYHLHQLTRDLELDYFILFSSATTLFGNPGQGNYVAGNASLEALARNRRSSGLPATCVRWGAIDDAGFLARNADIKEALQGRMGGAALKSEVALGALESMLLADRSGLGVLELDWRALARFLPAANSAKYSEMAQQDAEADSDNSDDIQELLTQLSDEELQVVVIGMIKHEVGEILRVDPEKIDATLSIYDMGLDSLMGVELVLALESRFGVRLSVMTLNATPTIVKLAEKLIQLLKGSAERSEAQQQVAQIAAQHGAEITDELAASLIKDVESNSIAINNRMIS